ncbi:uncharacterized protein LOC116176348 [Photinus pyralis]|uniref:uncharacterized protein LOC116176348 n=1 Tax=Photinus pyralis TaxID=7054 RepID=UPI0012675552|nr:uncharacterized protein LOC116176348 [Photinus pyralis]
MKNSFTNRVIDKPITNTMKVCSARFTKEDYISPDVAHKRKCLKKTACPSRNLPQIRHQSAVNHETKAKREDRYVRRQQLLEKAVRLEAADTLLLLANTEANTQTKEEKPVNEMCCETESSLNVLYKDVSVQVNTYLDQISVSLALQTLSTMTTELNSAQEFPM